MTENLLSLWIWFRERVDSDLRATTMAMVSENNLSVHSETLERNKEKLVAQHIHLLSELSTKARLCRSGSKELRVAKLKKLLPLMKPLKACRHQIALADQHMGLLQVQINAFENGRFQKTTTDTLRASMIAMKRLGITDEVDVDNLIGDMEFNISQQRDTSDSMDLVNSMDDPRMTDESLMAELMAFMGGDEEEEEDTTTALVAAPLVQLAPPATEPPVSLDPVIPRVGSIPLTVQQQQDQKQRPAHERVQTKRSERVPHQVLASLDEEDKLPVEKQRLLERGM